jgi:hypothetical protein
VFAGFCESVGLRDFLNHIAKSIGVPSHHKKISFRLIQLFRDFFLFITSTIFPKTKKPPQGGFLSITF